MVAVRIFAIFFSSSLCLYIVLALIRVVHKLWWAPIRIQHQMRSQGITGLPYRFVGGSTKEILNMKKEALSRPMGLSHDLLSRVQPHVHSWVNKYGNQKEKTSNYVYFTKLDRFSFSYIPPPLSLSSVQGRFIFNGMALNLNWSLQNHSLSKRY